MNTKPSTAEQAAVNATKPAQSPKPQKSAKTLAFDKALAQIIADKVVCIGPAPAAHSARAGLSGR